VVAIALHHQESDPLVNLEFFLDQQVRAGAGLGHRAKARAKASPLAPKNT